MIRKKFSENLAELKGEMSKNAFAKKCDVPYSTMNSYLLENSEPDVSSLVKIAEANNVTVGWLVGEESKQSELSIRQSSNVNAQAVQNGDLKGDVNITTSSELDDELPKEIQQWMTEQEKNIPGFKSWFRIEFGRKFPEFAEWRKQK